MILIAALSAKFSGATYHCGVIVVLISDPLEGLSNEAADRFGVVGEANKNCDLVERFVGESSGAVYRVNPKVESV
jgi:hypothetical protein